MPRGFALDSDSIRLLLKNDRAAQRELGQFLRHLEGRVAVRSSALNEDGSNKSFAGAFDTKLGVNRRPGAVIRAIAYVARSGNAERVSHYAKQSSNALIPVVVQEMVRARRAGVLFTKASGMDGKDCVYAEWVSGRGDVLVSGKGRPATITIPWNEKGTRLVRDRLTVTRALPAPELVDRLINLAEKANSDHSATSWDIEWAEDDERVWALQMRPVTAAILTTASGPNSALGASKGVATGNVRIVDDENHRLLKPGEVLVARITEINYVPAMKRAAAIVTEEGGLLSHAAIVARELGKPCVVGVSGALTRLSPGKPAEVNGTFGIVRQGNVTLGNEGQRDEIDWTSLYLYDRGIELKVAGTPVYVEPTMAGLVAYLDEALDRSTQDHLRAELRSIVHQEVRIAVGDKRIWYREWRRFNTLMSIALVDSLFRSAIAGWSEPRFNASMGLLKEAALEVARRRRAACTGQATLFWSELGAALHALVAVEVEGQAVWAAYRETQEWRTRHGIPFAEFMSASAESSRSAKAAMEHDRIAQVLRACGESRNSAYLYFSEIGAFDGTYFRGRNAIVKKVARELQLPMRSEGETLDAIYNSDSFRRLDAGFGQWVWRATERHSVNGSRRKMRGD